MLTQTTQRQLHNMKMMLGPSKAGISTYYQMEEL